MNIIVHYDPNSKITIQELFEKLLVEYYLMRGKVGFNSIRI